MGWDRPLGLLEATVDELLRPTPSQVADAVHTAANTLHAAVVAVHADTAAAAALVAAAKAAAAAAQQAGSGTPPWQALAADQPALMADQPAAAAGSAAAADGDGGEEQARCFAWDAAQHATRYLKHAAAAAQDSATAAAMLQAATLADAAAAALAPTEAQGATPAEPVPPLLWRSRVSCTYDVPSCGKRSMAELVGDKGSASGAAASPGELRAPLVGAAWWAVGPRWHVPSPVWRSGELCKLRLCRWAGCEAARRLKYPLPATLWLTRAVYGCCLVPR